MSSDAVPSGDAARAASANDRAVASVALEVCAAIQDEQQGGDGAEALRRVAAALRAAPAAEPGAAAPATPGGEPTDEQVEAMYDAMVSFTFPTRSRGDTATFEGRPDREEIRGGLRKVLAGAPGRAAPEPTVERIEAMIRRLQELLNEEPEKDDDGWMYADCERLLHEALRAGDAPLGGQP